MDDLEAGLPEELRQHPRYRILRLLGRGGMGVVYEAEHRVLARPVALKLIHRQHTVNPAAVERFLREVRAVALLQHPHIVTAYDAEQAGDVHFLVMEFVRGLSLDRLLHQQGALPAALACRFAREAALGLPYAHEKGMVHRDIKPDNLMLALDRTRKALPLTGAEDAPGTVKILDFGLAALAGERSVGKGLTSSSVVMGTPDYIAPEQARNARQADGRSDLYSLGCTLYQLLTGRVPYPAASVVRKLISHLEGTPTPLGELRPDVPLGLAEVLQRLLARDPAERYQTTAAAAAALAPFAERREEPAARTLLTATPPDATPVVPGPDPVPTVDHLVLRIAVPGRRPRRGRRAFVAGLLALAGGVTAAGLGWRFWPRGEAEPEGDPAGEPAPSGQPAVAKDGHGAVLETSPSPLRSVAISPDARLAVAGSHDGTILIHDLAAGRRRGVLHAHEGWVNSLAFSPDGERLVSCGTDNRIRIWNMNTGEEVRRLEGHAGPVDAVACCRKGQCLLSSSVDRTVRLWDLATGQPLLRLEGHSNIVRCAAPSPDGRRAVSGSWDYTLRLWDLETGKCLHRLVPRRGRQGYVMGTAFTPDGRHILSGSHDGAVRLWDAEKGTELCQLPNAGAVEGLALAPDGRRFLTVNWNAQVNVWDIADGPGLKPAACFEGHTAVVSAVAVAPDGRWALSAGNDGTLRRWDLPEVRSPES
jgi:serine/threonine protein kinase